MSKKENDLILWVDLEETLIYDWDSGCILLKNAETIKEVIKENKLEEINIFSWAILDDGDKKQFENELKGKLETFLECKIKEYPSVDEYLSRVSNLSGSKGDSFIDYIKADPLNDKKTVVLIDDDVDMLSMYDNERKLSIELINIKWFDN